MCGISRGSYAPSRFSSSEPTHLTRTRPARFGAGAGSPAMGSSPRQRQRTRPFGLSPAGRACNAASESLTRTLESLTRSKARAADSCDSIMQPAQTSRCESVDPPCRCLWGYGSRGEGTLRFETRLRPPDRATCEDAMPPPLSEDTASVSKHQHPRRPDSQHFLSAGRYSRTKAGVGASRHQLPNRDPGDSLTTPAPADHSAAC